MIRKSPVWNRLSSIYFPTLGNVPDKILVPQVPFWKWVLAREKRLLWYWRGTQKFGHFKSARVVSLIYWKKWLLGGGNCVVMSLTNNLFAVSINSLTKFSRNKSSPWSKTQSTFWHLHWWIDHSCRMLKADKITKTARRPRSTTKVIVTLINIPPRTF